MGPAAADRSDPTATVRPPARRRRNRHPRSAARKREDFSRLCMQGLVVRLPDAYSAVETKDLRIGGAVGDPAANGGSWQE
jgi:hypothetical protein